MQSPTENQADTVQDAPPLGRTPSENVRVRKEQQGAVQFCARLGRTPTETHQLLGSAYQEDALRKTVTKTYHKRFQNLGVDVYKSNTKAKKAKNTTDKKPSLDGVKSEENGGAKEAENEEVEKMNVEQGTQETIASSNGGAEASENGKQGTEESNASTNGGADHSLQPEPAGPVPQEANKDSTQNTPDEGSDKKVEGTAEA